MYPIADGRYVIYDLNTQPTHSLFEQEMFLQGLQMLPSVFLNLDIPYGFEDPKGVLRILSPLYAQFNSQINDLFLQNPFYINYFINRMYSTIQALMKANRDYEACKAASKRQTAFWNFIQRVVEAQGLMPVNWLIPREQLGEWLGKYLPQSSLDYLGNFSSLLVPNVEPHYLRVHRAFLALERKYLAGDGSDRLVVQFVNEYGFLYFEPVMDELEMIKNIHQVVNQSLKGINLVMLDQEIEANDQVHRSAGHAYQKWSEKLLERADRSRESTGDKILLRSLLRLGRAIADQEEERRIWQNRFYRNLVRLLKGNSVRIEGFSVGEVGKLDFGLSADRPG